MRRRLSGWENGFGRRAGQGEIHLHVFAGHYGVAFGLKAANRPIRLLHLFLAVQLADMIWAVLVLVGVERVRIVPGLMKGSSIDFVYFPYSHSLFMTFLWAGLAYVVYRRFAGFGRPVVIALAVVSHYVLDALVHRPDLPVWLGANPARIGLGMWNLPVIELMLEGLLVAIGLKAYTSATVWRTKAGRMAPWAAGVFLMALTAYGTLVKPAAGGRLLAASFLLSYFGMAGMAMWLDRQRG